MAQAQTQQQGRCRCLEAVSVLAKLTESRESLAAEGARQTGMNSHLRRFAKRTKALLQ